MTDSHDRVTLMTILSSFYNHQLVEAPSYSLAVTTTDGYTAPPHTDLKVSLHATGLPCWTPQQQHHTVLTTGSARLSTQPPCSEQMLPTRKSNLQ